jgi:CBS domain-containing protein
LGHQSHSVSRIQGSVAVHIAIQLDPGPDNLLADVDAIKEKEGFSSIPITEDGTLRSPLVGIVTNRDIEFEENRRKPLRSVMTTALITHPDCLGHVNPPGHPERVERLQAIAAALEGE